VRHLATQTAPFPALVELGQSRDFIEKKTGAKLGTRRFIAAWTLLSVRIYKIRTLLSTGFVDNVVAATSAIARKALPGAGFRHDATTYWDSGQ
jgi:hypothetical protein